MYEIIGTRKLTQANEIIDTATTKQEANFLLFNYQLSFGIEWTLTIRINNKNNNYET